MTKPLTVCITYDDNFEPMCAHLCSNLRIDGIRVRLNKTESKEDYRRGFQSQNWYMNLSEKILFLRKKIDHINQGEVICVADADIQVFQPHRLLEVKSMMESSDLEYVGQREGDRDIFNGGFFFIKKNDRTLRFIDIINSKDLSEYHHAEQDVINELIPSMGIRHRFLSRMKYLNGCMRLNSYVSPNILDKIVMHHASCAYNGDEKMQQMNFIREKIGMSLINWSVYAGIQDDSSQI